MSSMKLIRKACTGPLKLLLVPNFIRRRIIFEILQKYFNDLNLSVPIGEGLKCPIYSSDAWCSFEEIFFSEEYFQIFNEIPLPNRWLDIGCHVGYFSLYVHLQRLKQGLGKDFKALLIDGDSRTKPAVEKLISMNSLEGQIMFEQGVISRGEGSQEYIERDFMASSPSGVTEEDGIIKSAPTISGESIKDKIVPPYDLVKVDIEGSEYDFLSKYGSILEGAKHLILEYHSWHSGGGGVEQIYQMVKAAGFEVRKEISQREVVISGKKEKTGVLLLKNTCL